MESSYLYKWLRPRCWINIKMGGSFFIFKSVSLLMSYMIWVQTGVSQVVLYLNIIISFLYESTIWFDFLLFVELAEMYALNLEFNFMIYIVFNNFMLVLLLFIIDSICSLFTLLERKVMGFIHFRFGPNKLGFIGVFQPFSGGLILFTKEYIFPINWICLYVIIYM